MENAYSIELNRIISAESAIYKAYKGELQDEKAFKCPSCKINMTCSNFPGSKGKGKNKFFKPSNNDKIHEPECDCSTVKENEKSILKENEESKDTLNKSGLINLTKVPAKYSDSKTNNEKIENYNTKPTSYSRNNKDSTKSRNSNSNSSSLKNIVLLFQDRYVDNTKKRFLVNKKLYSLNELFIPLDKIKYSNIDSVNLFIFHGYATVEWGNKSSGLILINFAEGLTLPYIATNSNPAFKKQNTKQLEKYIENGEKFYIYFRGYYSKVTNRFTNFNKKFYDDILVE